MMGTCVDLCVHVCVCVCTCGDKCPFSRAKYVSLCQTGADGSYWSSPKAKGVLLILSGLPLVMETDPRLESKSIKTDCDEQDN